MPTMSIWNELIADIPALLELADNKDAILEDVDADADNTALTNAADDILAVTSRIMNAKVGTGIITATNTSVTIPHGYGSAPRADQISIKPTNQYAANYWITGIGSANFVVNVASAPGTGNTGTFAWEVL
jgi:hypothetical protein